MLYCRKCEGRIFIDRVHSNKGDIDLFCIKCGARWMLHKSNPAAQLFTKLEKLRERSYFGYPNTKHVLSRW
jgi:hypothetical protein